MRFTTKLKKKTAKTFKGERKVCDRFNKKDDDQTNKSKKTISFKNCKYAKFVPNGTVDYKLEDKSDLLAPRNNTLDKKLDRSEHLHLIANFIFTTSYCSRSVCSPDIVHLNKRVKRDTENFKTDKSDTEAMQMLVMCKEFQKVIRRTINGPLFKKRSRTHNFKGYEVDLRKQLSEDVIHRKGFLKDDEEQRISPTHTESTLLLGRDFVPRNVPDGDNIDSGSRILNDNSFIDNITLEAKCSANIYSQKNRSVQMLCNMPLTTGKSNYGFEKEDVHQDFNDSVNERQYVMPYNQTTIPKQRYLYVNNQNEKVDWIYTARLLGEDATKRHQIKFDSCVDDTGNISDKLNCCPSKNHEKTQELQTKLHRDHGLAKMVDSEKKHNLNSRKAETDNQTSQKFVEETGTATKNNSMSTAVVSDNHRVEIEIIKKHRRPNIKCVPAYSCKDVCKLTEIRNKRRFGDVNEEHCKAVYHLVTQRLTNVNTSSSVCVFIKENLNEIEDLASMKIEFTKKCLSSYFYPGKNIVTINIQRDLEKFLHRTVFQKLSAIKDVFGDVHFRSDAIDTKAVIMVSQPISSLLRHKDICMLDTLHVALGIDRSMMLVLEALGKS